MSQLQPQIAALWEDLKDLVKSVVEEMNQAADLRSKTGGLEVQSENTGKIVISKRSLPRMYVTVDLRPAAIDIGTRMVFSGAAAVDRQIWDSLYLKIDENGAKLRNKAGEVLTVDQAVYYILRPFLHLGTLLN
jgi:hypothetical protein